MNPCEEEPAWKSLKAAIKNMRTLSRGGMTERSHKAHKGAAAVNGAVNRDLRPVQVPNIKGKTPLLSTFDGQDSRNFIPWLIGLKCYFEGNHLSDSEKFKVGVSCLKGSALVWLTTLNLSRLTKGKGTIKSWHKLEFHMKENYTPSCEMTDLKATMETLRQNLLSNNKNAKPFEKPHLDIEPKLETVTTCLKPKPESTEQTSLKVVFQIDKMNQPLSGGNLESEPETVKQTEFEIACSPTEVNHVSVACIVRCLSPLKNEFLSVSHGRVVEHPAPTSPEPLKLTYTGFTPIHCESQNQISNLSPNETISNHLVFVCQAQKNNQPTSHFTTGIHESLHLGLRMSVNGATFQKGSYCHLEVSNWGKKEHLNSRDELQSLGLITEALNQPAHVRRPRHFLLVFDPGGRKVEAEIKNQKSSLDQARCEEKFFFLHSEFEVKFF